MKAMMTVLLLAVAGSAWAQSAPPSQTVTAAKPAATTTKTAPAHTAKKPGATTTKATPAQTAKKPATTMTKPAAAQTAAKPATAKQMPVQKSAKPASATMQKPATTMKPSTTKAAVKPAMKPAVKPAVSKAKAATPFAKPAPTKVVKKTPVPAAAVKAAAPAPRPAERISTAGKRDPFVSPVVERAGGVIGPPCETGKKCLAIGSVVLRGIVKAPAGMIAVVENNRRATYFLHENDPVFNGYVVRITPDSVVFRENILDAAGKTSTHDVVKKMAAPAV